LRFGQEESKELIIAFIGKTHSWSSLVHVQAHLKDMDHFL